VNSIPQTLQAAIAAGEFDALAALYADAAILDASVRGRRVRRNGTEAIATELARLYPGPGRVLDWDASEFDDGLALWVERLGEDGDGVRQRHYLRYRDGLIAGHWIYAAPPRDPAIVPPAGSTPAAPRKLLERFGAVREQAVLDSTGWSGSRLESAVLENGRKLVLKRIVPGGDWLARHTGDEGREGILFAEGAMSRFPADLDPATRAAEPDAGAWWIAMDDVSGSLFGTAGPISHEQSARILEAMAGVWHEFWGERLACAASSLDRTLVCGPGMSEAERDGVDLLAKQLETTWELFGEAVDADVGETVLGIAREPARFVAELERCGSTLIHGDLRDEQLGIDGERVIAIDWGLASNAHPAFELAWYLMHCHWRIEASREQIIEDFRRAMGERHEPRALELGLISGLVQYGWILGNSALVHPDPSEQAWAREEIGWWVPRVRQALEATGVA
jgi:hypothetical protein